MKAAIRIGLLGYNFSFIENHVKPNFDPSTTATSNKSNVYIKVKSAGINPVDYKLPKFLGGKTIGIDFCGTIEDIGSEVNDNSEKPLYKVGDDVFGTCTTGSLAEYCIAKSDCIAKKPEHWSFEECAALPVAYMSALQCLRIGKITQSFDNDKSMKNDQGEENKEKAVLVIGASGGCGIAGIQLCKAMGVGRIIAICSNKNTGFVKNEGATEVVPYDDKEQMLKFFQDNESKIDCVYDAATGSGGGEDYWTMSLPLLKKDPSSEECVGEYVALNGPGSKWIRAFSGTQKANESIMMMNSNTLDLKFITALLDKTGARPVINSIPFSDNGMNSAFKLLKSRRTKGKIVFHFRE